MYSGLNNTFLYCAVRIEVQVTNGVPSDDMCWSGTGFFVKNKSDVMCLVTNRHVLDPDYAEDGKYKLLKFKLKQVKIRFRSAIAQRPDRYREMILAPSPSPKYPSNSSEDVAVIINPGVAWINDNTSPIISYASSYLDLAPQSVFDADEFWIGDFVAVPGYPEWHDQKNFRPILRMGTLSSDPRYSYEQPKVAGRCIAFEAFSSGGLSGSPVFALQRGFGDGGDILSADYRKFYLIGVNTGHLRTKQDSTGLPDRSHAGISYMFTSPVILDLI